jgi:hypothetical protein
MLQRVEATCVGATDGNCEGWDANRFEVLGWDKKNFINLKPGKSVFAIVGAMITFFVKVWAVGGGGFQHFGIVGV